MIRTAVFVSGGGSNLQAIIDSKNQGNLPHVTLSLVLSSKAGVYALQRGERAGIPGVVMSKKEYENQQDFDQALINTLEEHRIEFIILAGYISILSPKVTKHYANRIINVHPSLIPSFCGKGYYGLKVHQEALDYGVKVTGATVHLVNEVPDGGRIIAQKAVEVEPMDTPHTLQKRVMEEAEWLLLPKAAEECCKALWMEKGRDK